MTRLRRSPRWRVGWAAALVLLLVAGWWGTNLWQLKSSVDSYAQYWSQPRGERGGLVYVALGDSAAQGIGASSPDKGYVGLIADRIHQETGRPVLVVNLSVSGAHLGDLVRDQLPRLAALPPDLVPDLVTVGIGGNDVLDYDKAEFARDAAVLTQALPACTVVADVPYFMHGSAEVRAARAGRVLEDAARAAGLGVAPLHDAQQARGSWAMATDFAADWFHPDDRGHRVWADAFWPAVRERLP